MKLKTSLVSRIVAIASLTALYAAPGFAGPLVGGGGFGYFYSYAKCEGEMGEHKVAFDIVSVQPGKMIARVRIMDPGAPDYGYANVDPRFQVLNCVKGQADHLFHCVETVPVKSRGTGVIDVVRESSGEIVGLFSVEGPRPGQRASVGAIRPCTLE